jgi:hypothetical protein
LDLFIIRKLVGKLFSQASGLLCDQYCSKVWPVNPIVPGCSFSPPPYFFVGW